MKFIIYIILNAIKHALEILMELEIFLINILVLVKILGIEMKMGHLFVERVLINVIIMVY